MQVSLPEAQEVLAEFEQTLEATLSKVQPAHRGPDTRHTAEAPPSSCASALAKARLRALQRMRDRRAHTTNADQQCSHRDVFKDGSLGFEWKIAVAHGEEDMKVTLPPTNGQVV